VGFFSGDKVELSPEERAELSLEERVYFLEKTVAALTKSEKHFWDAAILALTQIHVIVEVLEKKGLVGATELEEMRQKNLEAMRRIERSGGNGR